MAPYSGAGTGGGAEEWENPFVRWMRTPRPKARPGIWRYGHVPRPDDEADRISDRQLLGGAVLALLSGLLVWSLCWNGVIGIWLWPFDWITLDAWRGSGPMVVAGYVYYGLFILLLAYVFGRIGRWREVWTRFLEPVLSSPEPDRNQGDAEAEDPVAWPELRAAGLVGEAEVLGGAARGGGMNDVDLVRIARAWESVRARPERLTAFAGSVRRDGPAACPHPSGLRDIGSRAHRHDLVTGQVRIGAAPDDKRNPHAYRGGGIALEAGVLGTGLLAVGPAGNVVGDRVTGPVAELLCLQALTGQAAVVVVGAPDAPLGGDDAYDVVIRIADPSSQHDLDLYGGTADPDEAAALLAEALLGGDQADWAHGRPAVTALGQLIGAYQSAYGFFPGIAELRGLLDGDRTALAALRRDCAAVAQGALDGADAVAAHGAVAALRELDARERQLSRPGDIGALLADRLAVLDRPVFARFFDPRGRGRQFSMRAIEHPMRVRIVLPERTHAEASRVLARLLLAQFTATAPARSDRSRFAALVLDDAARTASPESVRALGRLRAAHAGVVLGLRGLDDVAEPVRGPLLAAVGCRMALTGVSTWDGRHFAEAWGAEWVEAEDVTHVPDVSGGLIRRLLRWVRQVFTGTKAMSRSVTVRTVERERWSASELANTLPPGHAVLSVTTVEGERTPPVLVDLHH
ncbi:hypothetical protein O7599_09480 [Streptomyces sp. WMMC500]|uniref:hypothetical protein n=1 Tax=Streptomyces sp. WMMC500 TaxID=3015154 RepID=UPI00248B2933|nr:hypothetical protein [Streptomyces sp. WMMC500]WBB62739.1 hypothetical protein O7599_09480 [Streptomyces sp. WMMC500]